jgi:hypothetical protein
MEVAVMSLSAREKYTLHSIEYRLSGSDPELASLMALFTRLTAGEDMPARETIQTRRASRRGHGNRRQPPRNMVRRLRQHVTWPGAGLVIAVLLAFALLATAVVLDGGSFGRGCSVPGTTCTGQFPGHGASFSQGFAVR